MGAGSAGCVIANRLSADPALRVGLIEAGGPADDPDIADPLKWVSLQGRTFDWAYRTVPQPFTANRVHEWPRGRVLGGSGALNAMAHVRGHPDDFDSWPPGWSYEALLPGFELSERQFGVWLPDAEVSSVARAYMAAGEALGAPRLKHHSGTELKGTPANTLTIRDGKRMTAADAYLTPDVLARPNLTLLLHHDARRITFEGDRATGVVAVHEGSEVPIEADRIVLCLGAVATPLLLMRSGIGDPAILGKACHCARREVGRNLQDHLLLLGNVYASRKPIPPSRLQHSESLMYLDSADISRATGSPDIVLACVVAPVTSETFTPPAYGSAFTLLAGVTHPTSRGTIDVSGAIDPHYLETEHDRRTMRRALETAREVGHHDALGEWASHEVLPGPGADLDAFIARVACTHHHPAGTCRMGTDAESVVDESLAVRGFRNLTIVDASVIPVLPSGPINAAVLAIAETWCARLDAG